MPNPLLILGAGASSGSDTTGTPPLGSRLFAALQKFNPPGWGRLPDNLRAEFERDFEAGMTRLSEQLPHGMAPLQRALAAYFFQFRPGEANLYIALARRIRAARWPGAIVTLNYDRLLDLALGTAGLRAVVGLAATNPGEVELCFPHGCCHIFTTAVHMDSRFVTFAGAQVMVDGPVTVIADPAEFANRIAGNAVPPVMSYFEPGKLPAAGRSFIEEQRARLATLIGEASRIAVVGVQVRPHDAHLWDPLRAATTPLVYCSGPTAAPVFKAWSDTNRPGRSDVVLTDYFREALPAICEAIGLPKSAPSAEDT